MKDIVIRIVISANAIKRGVIIAITAVMLLGAGIIFMSSFSQDRIEVSGEFRAPTHVSYVKGGKDGVVTAITVKWNKNTLADRTYVVINMNGFPKILDDGKQIYDGSGLWVTFSDPRYLHERFYIRLWSWNEEFGLSKDYFDLVVK